MARESDRIKILRRTLGEQLANFRRSVGLTQEQLGRRLYCNRSLVAHIEAGTRNKNRKFWQQADEICQAEGALLCAFMGLEKARVAVAERQRDIDLAVARARVSHLHQENFDVADSPRPAGFATQTTRVQNVAGNNLIPSVDVAVIANQAEWRKVRHYLIGNRTVLMREAARLYDRSWHVRETPTLATSGWIPGEPLPLEELVLEWEPNPVEPTLTGKEAALYPILPLRTLRQSFLCYTSAIRYLDSPKLFENRPCYRLIEISNNRLRFALTTYFDKLDIAESLGHEYAMSAIRGDCSWPSLPFRMLMADPFDLSLRAASAGVSTLTIRRNTQNGSGTFFMLERDHGNVVAMGASQYGVIPAGEFQPASVGASNVRADLDLWRNMVREYSEELLGQPEHDGSSGQPINYDCWPFFRDMERARATGSIRIYYLGTVLHALGLNVSVLTVAVMDDVVFDQIFRDRVSDNPEGRIVTNHGRWFDGLPFTEDVVQHFLRHRPLTGSSAACLAMSWVWRDMLGLVTT